MGIAIRFFFFIYPYHPPLWSSQLGVNEHTQSLCPGEADDRLLVKYNGKFAEVLLNKSNLIVQD